MIQATLFNYFTCNNSNDTINKQPISKSLSFKQTILNDYFPIKPKKKNLIINYFKQQQQKKEVKKENKQEFELMLVDIEFSTTNDIKCVKKNMYDPDLKYIAISYRWGELNEQLVKTPDYTAHITSFHVDDLKDLCYLIMGDSELNKIPYLWIDAISVNQHDHTNKKNTILKMSDIYKRANYILAVPDLHKGYLEINTANEDILDLIQKYSTVIYNDIHHINKTNIDNDDDDDIQKFLSSSLSKSTSTTMATKLKNKLIKGNSKGHDKEEIKKVYRFLAYLIDDWSNRAWVISEYHIAKEKQQIIGTPIKYMFISLLCLETYFKSFTFFSYSFDDHHIDEKVDEHDKKNNILKTTYKNVDNGAKLIKYFKTRFTQRNHLNMILNSKATRNEDRFNAILPSWSKYHHLIKDKNTISEWKITNMISVRLKIYEFMTEDDHELWNKARLLYACAQSESSMTPILPTFASQYDGGRLFLFEIENQKYAIGKYTELLVDYELKKNGKKAVMELKSFLVDHIKQKKLIFKRNLVRIQLLSIHQPINHQHLNQHQLNHRHPFHRMYQQRQIKIQKHNQNQNQNQIHDQYPYFLSVKAMVFFIVYMKCHYNKELLSSIFSIPINTVEQQLKFVYLPFFSFDIPQYKFIPPINCTGIMLLGDLIQNKWIVVKYPSNPSLTMDQFKSQQSYIFHIY